MAKSELGTKRVCPTTGRKFYDLNKDPVISPYSGEVVPIAPLNARSRADLAKSAAVAPKAAEEAEVETEAVEFVSLDDAEAEQQGKKPAAAADGAEVDATDDEVDAGEEENMDAFIEEEEEGDADVSDIIGEGIDKEEET